MLHWKRGYRYLICIDNKADCCGCGACENACPINCITMARDEEGFLYPIITEEKCINCGLCEQVCPVINVDAEFPVNQDAYIVQITDELIRKESTAGGAFTAIAQYVLKHNGIVFGVAYDKNFNVLHCAVDNEKELWRFRNSKYVQSNTGDTYKTVEKNLKNGRLVCYSGTPCQIEGLMRYLKRDYSNLIKVDVVCHAVPSPLVWKKYVEMQCARFGKDISNIIFRDKHYGYKYSTMTVKDKSGKKVYVYGIDTDPMLRAFFSNICDRPSCYHCKFKKRYRVSDFTIWDCYPVYKFDKALDDDGGTTRLLIHSEKGKEIFQELKYQFRFSKVSADELTLGVKEMFYSVDENDLRKQFFIDANRMDGNALFAKYFPETFKVRTERFFRLLFLKIGVYNLAKRIVGKLNKQM